MKKFKALCPKCNKENGFRLLEENAKRNDKYMCDYCYKKSKLKDFKKYER